MQPKHKCVPFPTEFSRLDTGTEIRLGDLVVVVELTPGHFTLYAVAPDEIARYDGPKYRVARGEIPDTIAYIPDQPLPTIIHEYHRRPSVAESSAPTRPWWRFW